MITSFIQEFADKKLALVASGQISMSLAYRAIKDYTNGMRASVVEKYSPSLITDIEEAIHSILNEEDAVPPKTDIDVFYQKLSDVYDKFSEIMIYSKIKSGLSDKLMHYSFSEIAFMELGERNYEEALSNINAYADGMSKLFFEFGHKDNYFVVEEMREEIKNNVEKLYKQ